MQTYHKCIRCGICCISGVCDLGHENEETGVCEFLEIYPDKTTSCRKVKNDEHPVISIGKGCVIRQWPEVYKNFKLLFEERKENLMTSKIHFRNKNE